MEYDKIMAGENLENIVNRLSGCCAMLDMVHANMSGDGLCVEALYGCCESLKGICRDLDAANCSRRFWTSSMSSTSFSRS